MTQAVVDTVGKQEEQYRCLERKQSLLSDAMTKDDQSQGSDSTSLLASQKAAKQSDYTSMTDVGLSTADDQPVFDAVEVDQPDISEPCEEQNELGADKNQLFNQDGRHFITTIDQLDVNGGCDFEVVPNYAGIIELD